MYEYVQKIVEEAPKDMTGVTKTPAFNHLFVTNSDCHKLPEKMVQIFHHIIAKLLYLCRRTQQDIQTAVAFLFTRVKNPDSDDYKKLTHIIQYLRGTQDLTLTINPGDHLNWWVDSSYAIHPDMRSYSGVIMMLGKGAVYSSSCKQKLNTKSSMEAELVCIDDAMGQVLWTRHFLAAQGEYIPTKATYQDIKSTILLAENGRASSSKRTRHLNVRYYFITDQIKKGHMKVEFCPTQEMIPDFFMKPLQGALLIRMQEKILNLPTRKIANVHRSVLKEHMKKKNPKTDPRAGDSANAGENKNDGKESKTNKTKENKTKKKSVTS